MFKDIKVEEIVVYLMLIVVGYYIAKMFSRSCNGFSVGGQLKCNGMLHSSCDSGTRLIADQNVLTTNFQRDCCE